MAAAEPSWEPTPADFSLRPGDVHVWRLSLQQEQELVQAHRRLLSADELERADRFRRREHGERYAVTRGFLRDLLARYLDRSPADLSFRYSDRGKPYLEHSAESAIEFNLSHSGGLALYALTRGRRLGIDIEVGDRRVAHEKISRRFFSAREVADLESVPAEARKQAFLNCWTRKEAYLKAIGSGLSAGLGGFSVSLMPGEPARLLEVQSDPEGAGRWQLRDLSAAGRYAAALCVEGADWRLQCFEGPAAA